MSYRARVLPAFAWLMTSCISFDEYPEGNLCRNAARDDLGRAVNYPEWRVCPAVNPAPSGENPDPMAPQPEADAAEPAVGGDAGTPSGNPTSAGSTSLDTLPSPLSENGE